MVDNLPLIPSKEGVCADVRPVLREVFRELDYLPPLPTQDVDKHRHEDNADCSLPRLDDWVDKYKMECKQLWLKEGELKQNRARSVSRKPQTNKYKLYQPVSEHISVPDWRTNHGIIDRRDLIPSVEQNAGREASLWVKNILARSSCEVSSVSVRGSRVRPPPQLLPADEFTLQSLSFGELYERLPSSLAPSPAEPPQPEYIVCVPPRIDFVNFTIGLLHTQTIRLVNVSKFEIRLSIRPPERRELDVELCGPRGLAVTSGAAAELRVHFTPRDVRVVRDRLAVRVSLGRSFVVPIACYMQPPILEIGCAVLVPSLASSPLCSARAPQWRSSDVLELGARLLGDVHHVPMLLHCDAAHAQFFLLTEDDWQACSLDEVCGGGVRCGSFAWWPARWAGGGGVRGAAACVARGPGLHAAALRLLACTAVTRPLHLLADALMFTPSHVTIEAQEKDYDICSEDDPACEYFVHLGTAFPGRSLTATVQLVNHSPVLYSYYWSVRPWGECTCAGGAGSAGGAGVGEDASDTDSERLCTTAREHRRNANKGGAEESGAREAAARRVRVSPGAGAASPRSARALHVAAPDVGPAPGVARAVLMLVLKDIPKESFPAAYDPMIVSSRIIENEPIPGFEVGARCVCDVVCGQLEVWWEVAPVRVVLQPPLLPLTHSNRVHEVDVLVRATQLFGCESVRGAWSVPLACPPPPPPRLTPATSCAARITVPLPPLPHQNRETDVITLVAENGECKSSCVIWRQCAARLVSLRPAFAWLGLAAPGQRMSAELRLHNDTYQEVEWRYRAFRWFGENPPSAACARRPACPRCRERACSCALLTPAGAHTALPHGADATLLYQVNAPERDGCVCTLVGAGGARGGAAVALAYRVLAPALALRVLPCRHTDPLQCEGCRVECGVGGAGDAGGAAVLRASRALSVGRRACCRLVLTNTTPCHTAAAWDPAIEGDDILNVTFTPNQVEIPSYGVVEIKVVLEARRVCGRRIFVHRAVVRNAYKPIYLLIDAAIAGVEVVCEVPLGDALHPDETVCIRRTQREVLPGEVADTKPSTPEEIFLEEDRRRDRQKNSRCRCPFEMVYIPPVKTPEPPELRAEDYTPTVEIVDEPPALTRVCPCCRATKPIIPDHQHPICLQFRDLPLRTVRSRRLVLRSACVLGARWSCAVRRWPRRHTRSLHADWWSGEVGGAGVALQCAPECGTLAPRRHQHVRVSVYATCWGLYRDQILIQIEHVEPIVLDVWVEAVGAPLHFAIKPNVDEQLAHTEPVMWMSGGTSRTLWAHNATGATLTARAYLLAQHQEPQDRLPFRLYLRLYDVPPLSCPCLTAYDSDSPVEESSSVQSSLEPDMDTAVELFLTADYGLQHHTYFEVSPAECSIPGGARAQWRVSLQTAREPAAPAALLLRLIPVDNTGECWHRPEPPPQLVLLQESRRASILQASRDRLCVRLCALHLPPGDVVRVRKRLQLKNVGSGGVEVCARTQAPWSVLQRAAPRRCGCVRAPASPRPHHAPLSLPPRSSTEICVEVRVGEAEACPVSEVAHTAETENAATVDDALRGESICRTRYEPLRRSNTLLRFYENDNLLLFDDGDVYRYLAFSPGLSLRLGTAISWRCNVQWDALSRSYQEQIPLTLEVEFPVLTARPDCIDFGFVADGDSRKTYFTLTHSSRTETLQLVAWWQGGARVEVSPRALALPPRRAARLYVQYTARWCGAPVEGSVLVQAVGAGGAGGAGGGAWCAARVRVRAAPARDRDCRLTPRDHTDDTHLLPPSLPPSLPH